MGLGRPKPSVLASLYVNQGLLFRDHLWLFLGSGFV